MKDEEWNPGAGALKDLFPPNPHPPGTPLTPTPPKKRRRRVGQLNDGEWLPGYGPDAEKKQK